MRGQLHSNLGRRLLRETREILYVRIVCPALSDPTQFRSIRLLRREERNKVRFSSRVRWASMVTWVCSPTQQF